MSIGRSVNLDLLRYTNLSEYRPDVGDYVTEVGWLRTRFGIVSGVRSGTIDIVFSGLPFNLCTYTEEAQKANTEELHISDIVRSKPGKYSIVKGKAEDGLIMMYI